MKSVHKISYLSSALTLAAISTVFSVLIFLIVLVLGLLGAGVGFITENPYLGSWVAHVSEGLVARLLFIVLLAVKGAVAGLVGAFIYNIVLVKILKLSLLKTE